MLFRKCIKSFLLQLWPIYEDKSPQFKLRALKTNSLYHSRAYKVKASSKDKV